MLSLDERIGSPEIRQAREVTRELTDEVNEKTELEWNGLPNARKAVKRSEYYAHIRRLDYRMRQAPKSRPFTPVSQSRPSPPSPQ